MRARRAAGLLVALEAVVALGAWAGTFSFASGAFDGLVERLPWNSPGLAAAAPSLCIAVPTTLTAIALLRRRGWAPRAALVTAGVLAVQLLGQTAFVGLSVFQPGFLLVAGAIAALAISLDTRGCDQGPWWPWSDRRRMTS